jgi:hypothetical protein
MRFPMRPFADNSLIRTRAAGVKTATHCPGGTMSRVLTPASP